MVLFIWKSELFIDVAGACAIDGAVAELTSISGVLNILHNIQFFDRDKSRSIWQLIKRKSRVLQKFQKYFNETRTSVSHALLIKFVLYSKDLLVVVFSFFTLLLFTHHHFHPYHHSHHLSNNSEKSLMS